MTYLEYEPCPEFSSHVGVPDEEVDDAAHDPAAGRLSGMHPRSEDDDLLSVEKQSVQEHAKREQLCRDSLTHPSLTSSLVFGDDIVRT